MKQLRLEVLFGGKNKLSPALKAIMGSSNAASRALKKTRDEIRSLNEQQKKIDGYQKQKKAVQDQAKALQDLQNHIKNLRQQMKTNPSADLTRDFDKSVAKARKLKQEYEKNRIELQRMRTEMNNAGLSTSQLSEHQVRLRNQLNQANQSMREQEQRLQRMTQMHRNYERQAGNIRAAAGYGMGTAMAGAGALYSMRKPIEESKKMDISENRIASIGLGKEATKEATDFARSMKTFGTSAVDNMNLVLDGATAFADVHHAKMVAPMLAKMKFANEAMFGQEQGADNEKKFMDMLKVIEMRNGLKSEKTFKDQANIIQQVITATGGRVQPEEWLNATKRGGLAVQGMTNEAFYYKMEPLVQMMGGHGYGNAAMSAYQNLYQGRTTQRAANNLAKFDLIGDPSKVKYNKTGDLAHLDIGAIKGAALFKKDQFAWMEQVLIPAINAKGITKEDDVVDVIGSFFSNRTASSLFARMYAQRENIHKNMKLNAGADNIDQLDARAQNTTSGKELEAKAKLHDAYLKFGTTILPVYTKAIEIATGALQTFTGWMERNPTLAKALGIGLLGIAASMLVIGGALVVFSPLILSMLSLRLMMASTATGATLLSRIFAAAPAVFNVFKSSILVVGRVFLWLGRALLMNPLGIAITLLATAAFLIYKNWEPIKSFFIDVWNKVGAAFQSGINWIKSVIQSVDTIFANNPIFTFLFPLIGIPRLIIANWSSISGFFSELWTSISTGALSLWTSITTIFQPLGQWFSNAWISVKSATSEAWVGIKNTVSAAWQGLCNIFLAVTPLGFIIRNFDQIIAFLAGLKDKFLSIGANIIDGLVSGITSGFEKLKSVWFSINSYLPDFMRKRMDIHSPSRVMAGLGGHIMGGIGLGLDQGFPNLKEKFQQALNIFNPRASEAISKIDVTPALNKVRPSPSLNPRQASGSVVIQGDTITIQITQAPGQSLQQLQAMLENMLDRREREKHARIRSSYKDQV
ncbi:phage tail tape measure protein [Acinetobacter modestus]|uniref:phage tail tape measure protein n=1 Tax=Acinetobacter modestus TaxID=1776740 RepID=UPI001F4BCB8B|nr:phage tail tape measure protein [Acinetobacter modestus]MCH7387677.1 phage tail tape measure protein [Acinetobacter modestus]